MFCLAMTAVFMLHRRLHAFKYMLLDFSFSDIVKILEFFHSEMLYKLG